MASKKAILYLMESDRKLASLIEKVGPCRLRRQKQISPFEALAESIVYQQLSGKAAARIFERVQALFPSGLVPQSVLKKSDKTLRSAGLSFSKIAALKDLASKTIEGVVPVATAIEAMEDQEIIERLVQVRGIGVWTVEMLLIFHLGRPDVFPTTDYGIRKGFQKVFSTNELPKPKELSEYSIRWRPYRTYAAWYLWRALELD